MASRSINLSVNANNAFNPPPINNGWIIGSNAWLESCLRQYVTIASKFRNIGWWSKGKFYSRCGSCKLVYSLSTHSCKDLVAGCMDISAWRMDDYSVILFITNSLMPVTICMQLLDGQRVLKFVEQHLLTQYCMYILLSI